MHSNRILYWGFTLGLLALVGCASAPVEPGEPTTLILPRNLPSRNCEGIRNFFLQELSEYQTQVDRVARNFQETWWKFSTADRDTTAERLTKSFEEWQRGAYDLKTVQYTVALDRGTSGVDPHQCYFKEKLTRASQLFERRIPATQSLAQRELELFSREARLVDKNNKFRFFPPGLKEPVTKSMFAKRMAGTASRSAREWLFKHFSNSRALRWLDWGFVDLIKARNEYAQLLGYPSFYEYSLRQSGIPTAAYREWLAEAKNKLAPRLLREISSAASGAGISKIEAWDLPYFAERITAAELDDLIKDTADTSPLQIARQCFRDLGMDVESYPIRIESAATAGKNPGEIVVPLAIPKVSNTLRTVAGSRADVRVSLNLKKPVAWQDIVDTVGALSRAVHLAEVKQPLAVFRGTGSLETQMFGELTERLCANSRSLEKSIMVVTGANSGRVRPVLEKFNRANGLRRAYRLVRAAIYSEFESQLYLNPDQELSELWAKLFREYWGIAIEPFYAEWETDDFLRSPAAAAERVVAILAADPLFLTSVGNGAEPRVLTAALGEKIKDILLKPGLEFPYDELIQQFSGKKASLEVLE